MYHIPCQPKAKRVRSRRLQTNMQHEYQRDRQRQTTSPPRTSYVQKRTRSAVMMKQSSLQPTSRLASCDPRYGVILPFASSRSIPSLSQSVNWVTYDPSNPDPLGIDDSMRLPVGHLLGGPEAGWPTSSWTALGNIENRSSRKRKYAHGVQENRGNETIMQW